MNLAEALSAPPAPKRVDREKAEIPKAGDPGTWEFDGYQGTINTEPTEEKITTWDKYIRDAGLDPDEVEVIEPVQVRGWDAIKREWNPEIEEFESNVVRMHYYRLNVRRKRPGLGIEELLGFIKSSKNSRKSGPTGDSTFVVAVGDLQLGKIDGDGVDGTVQRAVDGFERAAEEIKALRKHSSIGRVHVAWLGDCLEGFVSQGGMNAWRTVLTVTEQIRLLRKLMWFAVDIFTPLAEQSDHVAVPGNHDQAIRFGKGGVTRYDDSFDVDALSAVAEAAARMNRYDGVNFYTPDRDELSVTLETSGTILGHIHGHQTKRGKHFEWWANQNFGDQPVGQADILLAGHFHHFILDSSGTRKFIQVPALESESTWFRHNSGQVGDPGILTFTTQDKSVNNIKIV